MKLLEQLCRIHAPSGNEKNLSEFLLNYIEQHKVQWKVQPTVISGEGFQDCILLIFGEPRTAIFAHMDSIGFTVRYGTQLVKIGGPSIMSGYKLVGEDSKGKIECTLESNEEEGDLHYDFHREIERGTELVFKCDFRETEETVQSCYMDNRLGVWSALKVAETLENGIIAFSCWEEHGGGSVAYLAKYIYENYGVKQAIVSDITWVTEGVQPGDGVVISMRDSLIPRRSYVQKIISIAKESGVAYQLEVEGAGGSDAKELQHSAYPWDWCFIGAPEDNVHTPDEIVHKKDIESMVALYEVLMQKL
ncbi:putative aminopeptidase FrvX [Pontibacter aydingkolensis]|uniref:M20/M25/M40 family metallo-hydrolase n=1 Tax=Pontibacter aydingkolensis TaxID=1911536 RepID=A0ABS7CRF0_9BACT|nr:M20/M25/M40 family metallo-hydrolase [Pontibacter aydingkolensis]MBW7466427.1 M20/M25/M40 family metallo-hydrolase [Pontibacter aydingkolensis]